MYAHEHDVQPWPGRLAASDINNDHEDGLLNVDLICRIQFCVNSGTNWWESYQSSLTSSPSSCAEERNRKKDREFVRELKFGNLNYNAELQDVVSFFEQWGTVALCELWVDTQDRRPPPRQYAFLQFRQRVKRSGKGQVTFERYQSVQALTNGLPTDGEGSWRLPAPANIAHASPRAGGGTPTLW